MVIYNFWKMKSLLVLIACFSAPTVGLPFGYNGKKVVSPAAPNILIQKGRPIHVATFPPRMGMRRGIPKIIFLKQFLELECLKELYKHRRFKYRQGIRRPIESMPLGQSTEFRDEGQKLHREKGRNEGVDTRHFGTGRIIFVPPPPPPPPPKEVHKNEFQTRRGEIFTKTQETALTGDPKEKTPENMEIDEGEGRMGHPQVLSSGGEMRKSLENSRVLPEDLTMMVRSDDDRFIKYSQPSMKIATTTAIYPKSTSYQLWHLTRPSPIQPYEVEEIIEEKLRVDLEDDKEEELSDFGFGGSKILGDDSEGVPKEMDRVQVNRAEGMIDNSISAILRGLANPAGEGKQKKTSSIRPSQSKGIANKVLPPLHHPKSKGPGGRLKQQNSEKDKILSANDRIENHRSLNFTVSQIPFGSMEYQRSVLKTTSIPKINDQNSMASPEIGYDIQNLAQDLPTEGASAAPSIFRDFTGGTPKPKNAISTPSITFMTPESTNFSEEFLSDHSTTQDFTKAAKYISGRSRSDLELTTPPEFKEFTDDPMIFDLFSTTTRKEDGSWKNSRKMHFGQDVQKITISNGRTESREPEQRRSDILITDILEDYGDDEDQLSHPNYLERLKQNGSSRPGSIVNLSSSSLISLVPVVIQDLREAKISPDDLSVLSKAFGKYWRHIVALSNDTNLDMLPLLKMKDEKDLEDVFESLLLEDLPPTTTEEPQNLVQSMDYSPSYDYMEEYQDLYKDILGQETDKRKGFRSRRDEKDVLKRPGAAKEYFDGIRQEQMLKKMPTSTKTCL